MPKLSAGDSLVLSCALWLVIVGGLVAAVLVALTFYLQSG